MYGRGTRRAMIWILRNISVHLWITTLFAIPLSFYLLPGLVEFFPGINPLITGFVTIAGVIVIISFLMDLTAKKIIINLIKEGHAWERSGIFNKADKNYTKALRIYDTFLLWPFTSKKTAQRMSGAIAKFNLNSFVENKNFKLGTLFYLKINPADRDIAYLWLTRLRKSSIVTSFEQEILSMLAERYYNDKILSILILDIFLGLEREDFTAKKLYQHVLSDPELKHGYAKKIEALIGKPEDTLQKEVSFQFFDKKPVKKVEIGKKVQVLTKKGVYFLQSLWSFMGGSFSFLMLSAAKMYNYIKQNEKTRFYLKAGFLMLVSGLLLFFMVNTRSHIFKSRTIEKEKIKTPVQVFKPFTIQVAAYLKQKYAQRYVDTLKKKEIDARIKKVYGGGKTWYVVRVSEFIDRKSAAAYGQKLKKLKIIDDFFVNN
ncbi:MAG TPA: SPOR domain-containing protein, partial [Desulfobacterales bacterium]|nr:SPOR domain-containing protein [Desulfobacterales bacterium]